MRNRNTVHHTATFESVRKEYCSVARYSPPFYLDKLRETRKATIKRAEKAGASVRRDRKQPLARYEGSFLEVICTSYRFSVCMPLYK